MAWTAGVKPHPIVAELGLPLDDGGRIKVDRYCQVEGFDDVWAIGDAAAVPDPARPGLPSPPTCQHAIRQGRTVGAQRRGRARRRAEEAVHLQDARRVRRHGPLPGRRRDRRDPVARVPGLVPGPQLPPDDDARLRRRARLVADWTVGLLFGRDSSELGQLGHPPALAAAGLSEQSAGGTAPDGSGRPADANVR